jgi:hypothetical protein
MLTWFKNIVILVVILFSSSDYVSAQQDSVKTDSTHLYKNIESYTERHRLSKFFYRMVFRPARSDSIKKVAKSNHDKDLIKSGNSFEGKIIRKIEISTLDPFGYSEFSSPAAEQNFFHKAGNTLHISTRSLAIRNLLVIHKNQPLNTLKVMESERLIRTQKYVHEVFITLTGAGMNSDSVDISIRVLDKWSIIPAASVSNAGYSISLTDKNILGSGQELQSGFARNFATGINAFNANYSIPNITNTYISTSLHYSFDGYKNYNKGLTIDRPFFSPLSKWAASAAFNTQFRHDSLRDINMVYVPISLKYNTQDYWAGIAIRVLKGRPQSEPLTNIILAVRYLHLRYPVKPSELIDPLNIYSNEDFLFGTVGISARKYSRDRYIFKFGNTEDVPSGLACSFTGGYQLRNNSGRTYLGIRLSFGKYNKWGYLSPGLEYGTFLNGLHSEQGVVTAGFNYFTGLFEIGRWRLRQFIKPQVIIGINRFPYDSLTLNDGYGLDGFQSKALSGTRRLLLTLQTQTYCPWDLIGFHFGPYIVCSLGMLGNATDGFRNSRVYSQIGLGVMIKNENLVFRTFQFSISFYPLIPGRGDNILIVNSFKTTDFGFRDFGIGKPETVYNREGF